jgi:general secretion pathway protein K
MVDLLPENQRNTLRSESGVAMIIVILIVSLATALVASLTYSTYLGGRTSSMIAEQLKAEYIAKSAVNFARAMLENDSAPEVDAPFPRDQWAYFIGGKDLPAELFGLSDEGYRVSLEIGCEEKKLPIDNLVINSASTAQVRTEARDSLALLFQGLGFDDQLLEPEQTGLLNGEALNSEQTVAALIDFFDQDSESYDASPFAQGIEEDLPEGYFPNDSNPRINSIEELGIIPGFTPRRIKALSEYVATQGSRKVNINFLVDQPLLMQAINDQALNTNAATIKNFRDGPEGPLSSAIQNISGIQLSSYAQLLVGYNCTRFPIVVKIDYGASTAWAKAMVSRDSTGAIPRAVIRSFEMY